MPLVPRLKVLFQRVRLVVIRLRPLLPVSRFHILFLIHDYSYLRNFDDCIRGFLLKGHKVTIAFPEQKDGRPVKEVRKFDKSGGVSVRYVPRSRGDQFAALAGLIRSARSYLLYRKSTFVRATYLQHRIAEQTPRSVKTFLERPAVQRWPHVTDLFCRALEAGIPASDPAKRLVAELKPNVVLITPYFTTSTQYQIEYAKAAQELGVPVGVPVYSWDNLTSKGAMQVCPDQLLVWNQTQSREAASIHKVPASRITITGGMRFSKFFGQVPAISKEEFCKRVGLDPSAALITYLGSSRTIAPQEHEFLWRWIAALRAADDPRLQGCNVYVRPHPGNFAIWDHWPSAPPPGVAIWDRQGNDVRGIVDSVGNSVAVVGINTTAMLEAAALGKTILTVLDKDLCSGQVERIHFQYLTSVAGGLVTVANNLDEHVGHLTAVLAGDPRFSRKSRKFSRAFLRPPLPYLSPVRAFERAVERLARSGSSIAPARFLLSRLSRPVAAHFARRLNAKDLETRRKDNNVRQGQESTASQPG